MIRKVLPDPEKAEPKVVYYSDLDENTSLIVGAIMDDDFLVFVRMNSEFVALCMDALYPGSDAIYSAHVPTLVGLCEFYHTANWHVVACDTIEEFLAINPESL